MDHPELLDQPYAHQKSSSNSRLDAKVLGQFYRRSKSSSSLAKSEYASPESILSSSPKSLFKMISKNLSSKKITTKNVHRKSNFFTFLCPEITFFLS